MNCADITRIANSGSFAKLTEAERRAAEAHALICRDCAPVWVAHAWVAGMRIPQMPSELALRCRSMEASAQPERTPVRHLTLVSGLVTLAAAAGALMWYWGGSLPSASAGSVTLAVPDSETGAGAAPKATAPEATAEVALQPTGPEAEPLETMTTELPLVPAPRGRPPDRNKTLLALRKAVERHPDLVQGPPLDDSQQFFVSISIRVDGSVLDSAAELASPATSTEISNRLPLMLPVDAGEHLVTVFMSGLKLSNGSTLRARTFLRAVLIPGDFDIARSELRVREILAHKYDDLMTPSSSEETYLLTVFLSDDGRILREKIERFTAQDAAVVLGLGTSMRREETIAAKLGISTEQIGLIGSTTLEQGSPELVVDQNEMRRVEGVRHLSVRYAWERRMDETASIHAPVRTNEPLEDFDLIAALAVVERVFPDAFSDAPLSAANMAVRPTVVFTADGKVLRAGRVQYRNGVAIDSLLEEQLVPGVSTGLHRSVRLTNKAGATARVDFAWAE